MPYNLKIGNEVKSMTKPEMWSYLNRRGQRKHISEIPKKYQARYRDGDSEEKLKWCFNRIYVDKRTDIMYAITF